MLKVFHLSGENIREKITQALDASKWKMNKSALSIHKVDEVVNSIGSHPSSKALPGNTKKAELVYMIGNLTDQEVLWSNDMGWVGKETDRNIPDGVTTFTELERKTLALPTDGYWVWEPPTEDIERLKMWSLSLLKTMKIKRKLSPDHWQTYISESGLRYDVNFYDPDAAITGTLGTYNISAYRISEDGLENVGEYEQSFSLFVGLKA